MKSDLESTREFGRLQDAPRGGLSAIPQRNPQWFRSGSSLLPQWFFTASAVVLHCFRTTRKR